MAIQVASRPVLTLELARIAMSASASHAASNGWRVAIAIVDEGGHAVMFERRDGTQWSSCEVSLGKARAAAAFRRPSRLLEESVNGGRTAFLSIPQGAVLLQGGVPVEIDGQVVGAIGVSGVKAPDDEAIAQAGVDAIRAALGARAGGR